MNIAILNGRLGADPELKYTNSNHAVMRMRVATTERIKKGDKWEDATEWHTVVVWGKRAEGLNKFLSKGDAVVIRGRISTSTWDDKDGNKRSKTEIVSDDVEVVSTRREGRDGSKDEPRQQRQNDPPSDFDFSDGDIPF